MRRFWVLAFTLAIAASMPIGGSANIEAPPEKARLVIFEAKGCAACGRLRQDVLRRRASTLADAQLFLEVIDVDALGTGGHPLRAPIDTLPSVVVMHQGREVARLSGYPGRAQLVRFIRASSPTRP